jgi:hypothetical protein
MLTLLGGQQELFPQGRALGDGDLAMSKAACRTNGYTVSTSDAPLRRLGNGDWIFAFLKIDDRYGTDRSADSVSMARVAINLYEIHLHPPLIIEYLIWLYMSIPSGLSGL